MSNNPFLQEILAASTGGWAATGQDAEGFRPITPYVEFEDRGGAAPSSGAEDLMTSIEGVGPNVWDAKGITHFGGPQA